MSPIDLGIVLVYLIGQLIFGLLVGRRETSEDFLVAGRRVPTRLLVFSVVSTNVGVGTLVGIASAGYETGISYGLTILLGVLLGFLGMAFIAPRIKQFGDRTRAHTLGDFLAERYGLGVRTISAGVVLLAYFFFLAAQFVGLGALLEVWTGVGAESAVIFSAITMIAYTAVAGIKADFYTDTLHFLVMALVLFLVVLPVGLSRAGGLEGLNELPSSFYNPFSFAGAAFFFGGAIFSVPLFFTTVEIWQRIYAARSPAAARLSLLISGLVNMPFILFGILLGLLAKVLLPGLEDPDLALFSLMDILLPVGVLGLGLAAFFAAFLSTANSMLMVASATVVKDFYLARLRASPQENRILTMSRAVTLLVGVAALFISFWVEGIVDLLLGGFFLVGVLAPSVMGALWWRRATKLGSIISIVSGVLVTLALIGFMPRTAFIPGMAVSGLVFVVVSLLIPTKTHSPFR